jgi:hypothetical protein
LQGTMSSCRTRSLIASSGTRSWTATAAPRSTARAHAANSLLATTGSTSYRSRPTAYLAGRRRAAHAATVGDHIPAGRELVAPPVTVPPSEVEPEGVLVGGVMSATEAAIANHRLCLRKLLVGWKAATRDFQVPEERKATGQMVIRWTAQVHRFGQACDSKSIRCARPDADRSRIADSARRAVCSCPTSTSSQDGACATAAATRRRSRQAEDPLVGS